MLINGLNKTTLLDYPGRVAATIFTGGCNFRCPFCHNAGLVLYPYQQEVISEEEILLFLSKRKNILKGLCISGGEPTLQRDLPDFINKVKEMGYLVKLDTNGSNPVLLLNLIKKGLLDYVAMDIKNCVEKYQLTTGIDKTFNKEKAFQIDQIKESVQILKTAQIDYEFRTTVVKEFHAREDLLKIADWIKGCPRYFLQQYEENDNIIAVDEAFQTEDAEEQTGSAACFHGYEKEFLESVVRDIQMIFGAVGEVGLRGVD